MRRLVCSMAFHRRHPPRIGAPATFGAFVLLAPLRNWRALCRLFVDLRTSGFIDFAPDVISLANVFVDVAFDFWIGLLPCPAFERLNVSGQGLIHYVTLGDGEKFLRYVVGVVFSHFVILVEHCDVAVLLLSSFSALLSSVFLRFLVGSGPVIHLM